MTLSKSLLDTKKIAEGILEEIKPISDRAYVILLKGDLGSGKTAFTKILAELFGVKEEITSPTFIIQKIYELNTQKFKRLIHTDAYRINDQEAESTLNWNEISKDKDNLIIIEWPENIEGIIKEFDKEISFTFIDEETRDIKY